MIERNMRERKRDRDTQIDRGVGMCDRKKGDIKRERERERERETNRRTDEDESYFNWYYPNPQHDYQPLSQNHTYMHSYHELNALQLHSYITSLNISLFMET